MVNDTKHFDYFLIIPQILKWTKKTLITNTISWKQYFILLKNILCFFSLFKFLIHFNARKYSFLSSNFNFKIPFGDIFNFYKKVLNRYCVSPSGCKICICWCAGHLKIYISMEKYIYMHMQVVLVRKIHDLLKGR